MNRQKDLEIDVLSNLVGSIKDTFPENQKETIERWVNLKPLLPDSKLNDIINFIKDKIQGQILLSELARVIGVDIDHHYNKKERYSDILTKVQKYIQYKQNYERVKISLEILAKRVSEFHLGTQINFEHKDQLAFMTTFVEKYQREMIEMQRETSNIQIDNKFVESLFDIDLPKTIRNIKRVFEQKIKELENELQYISSYLNNIQHKGQTDYLLSKMKNHNIRTRLEKFQQILCSKQIRKLGKDIDSTNETQPNLSLQQINHELASKILKLEKDVSFLTEQKFKMDLKLLQSAIFKEEHEQLKKDFQGLKMMFQKVMKQKPKQTLSCQNESKVQIKSLRVEKDQLISEKLSLQDTINSKEQKIKRVEEQNHELRSKIFSLFENNQKQRDREEKLLSLQINSKRMKQSQRNPEKIDHQHEKLDYLYNQLENYEIQSKKLKEILLKNNESICNLEQDLEKKTSEISGHHQHIETLKSQNEELRRIIGIKQSENMIANSCLSQFEEQSRQLEAELLQRNETIELLKQQIDNSKENSSSEETEMEEKQLRVRNIRTEEEFESIQRQLRAKEAEFLDQRGKYDEQIHRLEAFHSSLQNQAEEMAKGLENEIIELKTLIQLKDSEMKDQDEKLNLKISKLIQENQELKKENSEKDECIRESTQKYKAQQVFLINQNERLLERLQHKEEQLSLQQENQAYHLGQIQSQLNKKAYDVEQLETQLETQRTSHQEEIKELKDQLESYNWNIQNLQTTTYQQKEKYDFQISQLKEIVHSKHIELERRDKQAQKTRKISGNKVRELEQNITIKDEKIANLSNILSSERKDFQQKSKMMKKQLEERSNKIAQQTNFHTKLFSEMKQQLKIKDQKVEDLKKQLESQWSTLSHEQNKISKTLEKQRQQKQKLRLLIQDKEQQHVQQIVQLKNVAEQKDREIKEKCNQFESEKGILTSQLTQAKETMTLTEEKFMKIQADLNQQKSSLSNQINKLEDQLESNKREHAILIEEHSRNFNQISSSISMKDSTIRKLQQQAAESKEEYASKLQELEADIESKNLQRQAQFQKLQHCQDKHKQEMQTFKAKIQQKEKSYQALEQEVKKQKQSYKNQISQLKFQNEQNGDKILELQKQLTQYTNENMNLMTKNKQILESEQSAKEELERFNTQFESIEQQLYHSRRENERILSENEPLRSIISQFKLEKITPNQIQLFSHELFENRYEEKVRLIQILKDYTGKNLQRANLLYKFDSQNKTNVHKYIDGFRGLLCIIKTIKKDLIVGYYPGKLEKGPNLDEGGLIIALTNNQIFKLHEKNPNDKKVIMKGMVHDDYYVKFGNSELRLKTGKREVFSNLGIQNGFYNARGHSVDVLISSGQSRETQFEICEYYQLILEGEQMT